MTPARHAVVVGGGLGGLAAAVGLRRLGWQVTVLERAAAPREAGAGISLLTNAQRALARLGVEVHDLAASMAPGGEGLRTPSGHRLQAPASGSFLRSRGLSLAILTRPELHARLRAALPESWLVHGAEATDVTDFGYCALVTYRGPRGSRTVRGDVVIAADGAHSRVRNILFPGLARPVYSGHSVWRGIASGVDGSSERGGSTWGRGLEFGRMPLTGDRVYWFAVANTPEGARYRDHHREVLRRFGSWHTPIPALIAATPPDRILHHDVMELAEPPPSYASGRIALLGDAAHAMTSDLGQGACQAFEDAVVLCASLAASPDDPVQALADYDVRRRPRAQGIAVASRAMGRRKLTERRGEILRRNLAMRLRGPRAGQEGMARVGDWTPPDLQGAER
ncbi:FAD-dependent monooxygenase [Spirillospora sp. NPDC049652]